MFSLKRRDRYRSIIDIIPTFAQVGILSRILLVVISIVYFWKKNVA